MTVRPGQLLLTQAAVALLLAGPAAIPASGVLLALAFGRFRGRWAYELLGRAPAAARAVETAELDGQPVTLVDDGHTLAAVVELGDPASLLAPMEPPLPPLADLVSPDATGVELEIAVTTAPAYQRVTVTVRAHHADGVPDDDLRRALAGALRRVRRRLDRPLRAATLPEGEPCRRTFDAPPGSAFAIDPPPAASTTVTAVVAHAPSGVRATASIEVGSSSAVGLATAFGQLRTRLDEHRTVSDGADLVIRPGRSGLPFGVNRLGEPVALRLFRPEPTTVVVAGGPALARYLSAGAAALGAHVAAQRERGTVPATASRPHLVLVDASSGVPTQKLPWQTTVTVRDELSPADADVLADADLVLLPQLSSAGAELAARVLGLGGSADWLTRIGSGMVGVVTRSPRGRSIRWALLEGGTPY